jgi:hypothetical protein
LAVFGLVGFVSAHLRWFGVAFLLSGALLLGAANMAVWGTVAQKWE